MVISNLRKAHVTHDSSGPAMHFGNQCRPTAIRY